MIKKIFSFLVILLFAIAIWQRFKPLPDGISFQSKDYYINEGDIEFLSDITVEGKCDQVIFNEIFKAIDLSREYILIDMFLFNSFVGTTEKEYEKLSENISRKLVEKINKYPDIKIDLITDDINTVYGGAVNKHLDMLKSAGVNVIITDLTELRDSNPLYSSVWRGFFQWFGNSTKTGLLKNPFSPSEQKVSLRSYLNLLNFKANHRKVFLADNSGNMVAIITSANPHDASSLHSNVAVKIKNGNFWRDVYESEYAVAKFSTAELSPVPSYYIRENEEKNSESLVVNLITEKKIKNNLLDIIKEAKAGDVINIAMFYLSDRNIIENLIIASNKGVAVRLILDPNKDAFGFKKNGIPNRQVAKELIKNGNGKIKIRWYNTNGEQFHSKLVWIDKNKEGFYIVLGSANLTKRNIENYNLESDVMIQGGQNSLFKASIEEYFNKLWNNENNMKYTLDYNTYKDTSVFKVLVYRFQEFTGLSGF